MRHCTKRTKGEPAEPTIQAGPADAGKKEVAWIGGEEMDRLHASVRLLARLVTQLARCVSPSDFLRIQRSVLRDGRAVLVLLGKDVADVIECWPEGVSVWTRPEGAK
jgi:hypothetical protein